MAFMPGGNLVTPLAKSQPVTSAIPISEGYSALAIYFFANQHTIRASVRFMTIGAGKDVVFIRFVRIQSFHAVGL